MTIVLLRSVDIESHACEVFELSVLQLLNLVETFADHSTQVLSVALILSLVSDVLLLREKSDLVDHVFDLIVDQFCIHLSSRTFRSRRYLHSCHRCR